MLSSALENNVKKVLYASSAAVYTGKHFSDSLPIDYSKQHNPYSQSKIINEMHTGNFQVKSYKFMDLQDWISAQSK